MMPSGHEGFHTQKRTIYEEQTFFPQHIFWTSQGNNFIRVHFPSKGTNLLFELVDMGTRSWLRLLLCDLLGMVRNVSLWWWWWGLWRPGGPPGPAVALWGGYTNLSATLGPPSDEVTLLPSLVSLLWFMGCGGSAHRLWWLLAIMATAAAALGPVHSSFSHVWKVKGSCMNGAT